MKNNKHCESKGAYKKVDSVLYSRVTGFGKDSTADINTVIHDFQAYQLKLEVQNERLKKAQLESRELQSKISEFYDQAPVGYFIFDNNGIILEANRTAADMLGVERKKLIKQPFIYNLEKNEADEFYLHQTKVAASGERQACEIKISKKNGAHFHGLLESMPVPVNGDGVSQFHSVLIDITVRKESEEKQRAIEDRYRLFFKAANIGLCLVDLEGQFYKVNTKMSEMVGYSIETLESMKEIEITHPEDMHTSQNFINRILSGKMNNAEFEKRYFHQQGRIVPCYLCISLIRDLKGNPLYFFTQVQDTTEIRQYQDALRHANEELGRRMRESAPVLTNGHKLIKQEITGRTQEQQTQEEIEHELKHQSICLEDLNTALKVMLEKKDEVKKELEENVLCNIKHLIAPSLNELKSKKLDERSSALLSILETNLNNISSSFSCRLSSRYLNLSPTEIQVADLIKNGKSTKEIAELGCKAYATVEFHRKNIRKKLGLERETNLRTYLSSIA
ncbi:MAG: PAS domain S-box protein [bacterium]